MEEDGSLKTGGMAEKVTGAYQKIEDSVVGGYKKVENAFVDAFLEKVDSDEDKSRIEPENFKQKRRWQKISCHRLFLIIEGGYGIPRAGVGIGPYRTTAIIARLGHTALCFRFTACVCGRALRLW